MAIPGLRGAEHIGITVPDLDSAMAFFTEVLGAKTLYEAGPFEAEDNWMAENLGVDPRARVPRLRMIRVGNGPAFEVFEYEAADQQQAPPRNSDIGGHHLAFYVDDIHLAVADLHQKGVTILGEPKEILDGPSKGLSWVYFLAPWGLQLELVSYPNGVAAYKT